MQFLFLLEQVVNGLVLGADLIEPRDRRRWENNPHSKDST